LFSCLCRSPSRHSAPSLHGCISVGSRSFHRWH
jgi:hypothetical protein